MNIRLFLSLVMVSLATAACGGGGGGGGDDAPPAVAVALDYIHYANVDNIVLTMTRLEHPLLDDNPAAVFLATQNLNPDGALSRVTNLAPISVQYIVGASGGHWWIFNTNATAMAPGVSFNISIMGPKLGESGLRHTVTADSRLPLFFAFVSDTGVPDSSLMFILPSFGSAADRGVINRHFTGVTSGDSTWSVYNEDYVVMPLNARFMLGMVPASANNFVHEAVAGNISGRATTVRHPLLDGNPNAIIQVTHVLNGGSVSRYSDKPLAVQYSILSGVWQIANQDGSAMTPNTAFHVSIRR